MRNKVTDILGGQMNDKWESVNCSVDDFINSMPQAFDIKFLSKAMSDNNDKYAHFHVAADDSIYQFYYWESNNKWACKA